MGSTGVRIAIDAMGGDNAPGEIVAGALRAVEELGVKVLLVGSPEDIEPVLPSSINSEQVEIVPAEGAIAMDEEPLSGIRRKPKASINVAMSMVKKGRADAVISAGHSGAAMAAALRSTLWPNRTLATRPAGQKLNRKKKSTARCTGSQRF